MINLLNITYYPAHHRYTIGETIHIMILSDQEDLPLFIFLATLNSLYTFLTLLKINRWSYTILPLILALNVVGLLAIFSEFNIALALFIVSTLGIIILGAWFNK
jgi:hypothetical protein